jgi:hypothetical protein
MHAGSTVTVCRAVAASGGAGGTGRASDGQTADDVLGESEASHRSRSEIRDALGAGVEQVERALGLTADIGPQASRSASWLASRFSARPRREAGTGRSLGTRGAVIVHDTGVQSPGSGPLARQSGPPGRSRTRTATSLLSSLPRLSAPNAQEFR